MLKHRNDIKKINITNFFILNASFQEKFGRNLYFQDDKLKTYLYFWSKDQKIELLYFPYITKRKSVWGFSKGGCSFYERIVNKNILLIQEKGYLFAPLTLKLKENVNTTNFFSPDFVYKEVFHERRIKRYYLKLKSFFHSIISDTDKVLIKKMQNDVLFENLQKKFFFFFLSAKHMSILSYNFISRYVQVFLKKKTTYLSKYKYKNRYHFKFFKKKARVALKSFSKRSLSKTKHYSKEKKIYIVTLNRILNRMKIKKT